MDTTPEPPPTVEELQQAALRELKTARIRLENGLALIIRADELKREAAPAA